MLVCKQFNWPAPGGLQGPDKVLGPHLAPGVQDVKGPPAGPALCLSVFLSFSALMALPPPFVLPACLVFNHPLHSPSPQINLLYSR